MFLTKGFEIEMSKDNKYNTCGTLMYKDSKCIIEFDVCDYREPTWWITFIGNHNLTKDQKIELLKRISASIDTEVYEEKIGFVKETIDNIDGSRSILDF